MALAGVLRMLADDWDAVRRALPAEPGRELDLLVERFADEADDAERQEIAQRIASLLRGSLPLDHPIRDELRRGDRFTSAGDWMALSERLVLMMDPTQPSVADVAEAVHARLLAAPALGTAELATGVSPDDTGLIRFETPDGPRWPRFQFDAGGNPVPVVVEINLILGAADDPFGVADWWLADSADLGGVPASLLGEVSERRLRAAVRALVAGD